MSFNYRFYNSVAGKNTTTSSEGGHVQKVWGLGESAWLDTSIYDFISHTFFSIYCTFFSFIEHLHNLWTSNICSRTLVHKHCSRTLVPKQCSRTPSEQSVHEQANIVQASPKFKVSRKQKLSQRDPN